MFPDMVGTIGREHSMNKHGGRMEPGVVQKWSKLRLK